MKIIKKTDYDILLISKTEKEARFLGLLRNVLEDLNIRVGSVALFREKMGLKYEIRFNPLEMAEFINNLKKYEII